VADAATSTPQLATVGLVQLEESTASASLQLVRHSS